ncbi:MAG: NUDIX domain-containing protein [Nanoarchaeota archaeon]|nr:NUDIX domain-containing protein [Nanoarchaeota archaeon]MBU4086912.1 NUDIX domain-containing protein [Nanoarchaeota archaeon]
MRKYRKAVFIAVYRKEGKKILYLILKRKLHWKGWEFPKGGIENKETETSAVKRELKEETHQFPIKIIKFKEKGKYRYPKFLDDRPNIIGQTYRLFSAQIKDKKIKIDKKEHLAYKWLEFKKAIKILTWPNQKKCLRIVNRHINH